MDFMPAEKKWEALSPEDQLKELKKFLEDRIEKTEKSAAAFEHSESIGEQYCHYHFAGALNTYKEILTFVKLGQPGSQK